MGTRSLLCIFFLIWGILIGAALVGVYSVYPDNPDFFKVKISDLLNIATPLGIAIFITYFISTMINNESRRREIIVEHIDRVETSAEKLFDIGTKYIETPEKHRKILLSLLQNTSILISNLERILENENKCISHLKPVKSSFIDIKKSLTSSSTEDAEITPEQCAQFMHGYRKLVEGTSNLKFKVFK